MTCLPVTTSVLVRYSADWLDGARLERALTERVIEIRDALAFE